jgi:hypothetical protein
MIKAFLIMFIGTAFAALVWTLLLTNESTQEEQKEMLDSDEMFP